MSDKVILTLNAGSSSLKFALFTAEAMPRRLWSGTFKRIGLPGAKFVLCDADDRVVMNETLSLASHAQALGRLLEAVNKMPGSLDLVAVGHRFVNGGPDCDCPKVLTAPMRAKLRALAALAPLHMGPNLAGVDAVLAVRPDVMQIASFDTAFYHELPRVAQLTSLPRELADEGIRRYGFHGLSFEYVLGSLRAEGVDVDAERIVLAHLGNGASMVAIRNGRPIEMSSGFSTLAGLPMGTRSGDLDPGVVLFLMQEKGMTADEVATLLYHQSGLLGLSGESRNMGDLLASSSEHAAEAVDFFCYQAKLHLARLTGALGGLDRVVFTAGIGEKSADVRARICEGLGYLGLRLDAARNLADDPVISHEDARVVVQVRATDEARMIVAHVAAKLAADAARQTAEALV